MDFSSITKPASGQLLASMRAKMPLNGIRAVQPDRAAAMTLVQRHRERRHRGQGHPLALQRSPLIRQMLLPAAGPTCVVEADVRYKTTDGGEHVGRSGLNLVYRGQGQPADLNGFNTSEALRGLGIGTALLGVVRHVCTKLKIPKITGRVLPHESRAGELYLRTGASTSGRT